MPLQKSISKAYFEPPLSILSGKLAGCSIIVHKSKLLPPQMASVLLFTKQLPLARDVWNETMSKKRSIVALASCDIIASGTRSHTHVPRNVKGCGYLYYCMYSSLSYYTDVCSETNPYSFSR
jgi:hypothetical protein